MTNRMEREKRGEEKMRGASIPNDPATTVKGIVTWPLLIQVHLVMGG